MLIYSKIDGFHKFAKYTLCPPKSNPDYGSALNMYNIMDFELSSITSVECYHIVDLNLRDL